MKRGIATNDLVIWIFGIILGLTVVVFFMVPTYSQLIYGTCWNNGVQTIETIRTEADKLYAQTSNLRQVAQSELTVNLGPCVSVMGFMSEKDILAERDKTVFRDVCKGSDSYIVGMPHLSEYKQGIWQKIIHPLDTIKTWGVKRYEELKDKFHLLNDPVCKPLMEQCRDCEISEELLLEGPAGEKQAEYCLRITVDGKTASIEQIGKGPC